MADVTTEPTAAPRTFIGGSFAPPLDQSGIEAYRKLAFSEAANPSFTTAEHVADAVRNLCNMVELFQQGSPPRLAGTPHPAHARAIIVPLEAAEVKRIWDAVPWATEIEMLKTVFDAIPNATHKPLRDAAHHLLWFAVELEKDREPLTTDKL